MNYGFLKKKTVAMEIAKIYNEKGNSVFDSGSCSALNLLCSRLNIKPMHLNKRAGGTGEMIKNQVFYISKKETDEEKLVAKATYLVVKDEIETIVAELTRKGFKKPKGFSVLEQFIEDCISECE